MEQAVHDMSQWILVEAEQKPFPPADLSTESLKLTPTKADSKPKSFSKIFFPHPS